MTTRRKYNWPELFKAFDASGLNQTQFCKQHDLNPKYFSNKRSQFIAKQSSSGSSDAFHKVAVLPAAQSTMVLEIGSCKVHVPHAWSLAQTTAFIKALA